MIRAAMIATVALMLSAGPAAAEIMTGNGLLAKCLAYEKFTAAGSATNDIQVAGNAMLCRGYVWGYTDGENYGGGAVCYPDGVNYDQVLAVVIKYLKENPAQLHRLSAELVLEAVQEAWPCPK